MGRMPWSVVRGGYWRPPGPKFDGDPGVQGDHKLAQSPRHPPSWPGPIDGARAYKDAGEAHSVEFSPKGALNLHS
ncbi:hypothetical protein O181_125554 [Austropuccinia psidii MF-1]|uniref:Uncharacterized protein n=1 Tax=Austropuccinia psidii MF-1 TaxID=1389203 RepID=A0A9Q3KRM3_9BASI|nr:hypothetical protein [Austropuccinia psidii MF-1]